MFYFQGIGIITTDKLVFEASNIESLNIESLMFKIKMFYKHHYNHGWKNSDYFSSNMRTEGRKSS